MSMRGRIAYLWFSLGLLLLAGCGDFFTKENGSGGGGSTGASRVYVTNNGDNSISVFSADTSTGALTVTSSASSGTSGPQGIAIASGKFLFAGSNGNGVSGY